MVDLIIKNDGPSPIFTALLTELSVVFQERDDFRDEVERLTSEQGELAGLRNEVGAYANRLLDQDSEIARLQEQYAETAEETYQRGKLISRLREELAAAKRVFGDAFGHGETGPTRKNRPKLTPAQAGGIRSMVRNGSERKHVAWVYGVHPTTVTRIVNGTYHREVSA
jgi:hypothetical protein